MKIFRITQAYTKQYTNPILLNVGDVVFLGMEETEDKWKGWIWAELSDRSNAGWIPNKIIQFSENKKTGSIVKKIFGAGINSAQRRASRVIGIIEWMVLG